MEKYKGWKIERQHEGSHWLAYNSKEVLRATTLKNLKAGINGDNSKLHSREWI